MGTILSMDYISNSVHQTQKIASVLAAKFKNKGGVIALIGDLGAGKTTFTQGFAKGLGIKDKIISPTFVLIRQHQLPDQRWLFHLDLYRLEAKSDFALLGLEELFLSPSNIILIEWAEKIIDQLPQNSTIISFKKINQTQRKISLK